MRERSKLDVLSLDVNKKLNVIVFECHFESLFSIWFDVQLD